jgi:hypothetical protein
MMEAHQDLMGTSMGDMSLLGGLDAGYGGDGANAANLRVDDGSHSAGIAAELDLAMGGGCVMSIPPTMTIPLPAPVRAAVPRYLQVYWARIDKFLPMVHRQTFEAAPEDALMYAMAAVATQHLDSREDRARGNQLHEFAWQEVKRVSRPWRTFVEDSYGLNCKTTMLTSPDGGEPTDSPVDHTDHASHPPMRIFCAFSWPQGRHAALKTVRVTVFEGECCSTMLYSAAVVCFF